MGRVSVKMIGDQNNCYVCRNFKANFYKNITTVIKKGNDVSINSFYYDLFIFNKKTSFAQV